MHVIVIVCYTVQEVQINPDDYEVMVPATFSVARKPLAAVCWCQALTDVLMIQCHIRPDLFSRLVKMTGLD
jgi:hypothetical protein